MVITKDENRRWKYQLRLYRKALEASIPCITDPVILDAVLAYLMEGSTVKISKVLKTDIDFYVRNSIHHLHYFTYNQKYASMNFLINELEYYRKAIRSHIRKHKQETKKKNNMKNAIWYSTSAPTPKQRGQAAKMGYRFVDVASGRRLAQRPSNDHYGLAAKLRALDLLLEEANADAIFGDFEPPLLHGAWMAHMAKSSSRAMLFSSWKAPIQTWHEGSPIVHKAFISVGSL